MIGVKIIDVNTDNACEETIGTCELCMSSMYCDNPVITIEFTDLQSNSMKDFGFYFESVEEGKKAVKEVGKDRIKKYLFEVE